MAPAKSKLESVVYCPRCNATHIWGQHLVKPKGRNAQAADVVTARAAEPIEAGDPVRINFDTKAVIQANGAMAHVEDMTSLKKRMLAILPKSEAAKLNKLFAKLEKQAEQNRKNQKAWRERQKAK